MKYLIILLLSLTSSSLLSQNWEKDYQLPGFGKWADKTRENIYQMDDKDELSQYIRRGYTHALSYPVDVTGLLIPFEVFKESFNLSTGNAIQRLVKRALRVGSGLNSPENFYNWMGLNKYPKIETSNIPRTHESDLGLPMGATIIERYGAQGITFSCTACHSGTLFGKPVMGMSNRFVRANEVFAMAKKISPLMIKDLTSIFSQANDAEIKMLSDINVLLKRVKAKAPETLGLDTSSFQVGTSLYYLSRDPYASQRRRFLRPHPFERREMIPESKPAPWWNLKYKTKWLLDGSVISGNPIATNIIWNELGRGTDLRKVEKWMKDNPQKIRELTSAVFSTKAPRYEDFFGADTINIKKAKSGEKLFVQSCQKCHGVYKKNWSNPLITNRKKMIQNKSVHYHKKTPVIDVGTDADRFKSGKYVASELNRLQVLKSFNIVVKPQKGYIPPPLEGIWARWPYFHNNSAPSLCAVLTRSELRPKTYYSGKPVNKERDFDQECNGYPLGDDTPESWKTASHLYDTGRQGMRNTGHDKRIFLNVDGSEKFSKNQKMELIEFLKTL